MIVIEGPSHRLPMEAPERFNEDMTRFGPSSIPSGRKPPRTGADLSMLPIVEDCQTARNRGSDSLLMKFRRRLLLVSHKESTPWDRPYDLPHSFRVAS